MLGVRARAAAALAAAVLLLVVPTHAFAGPVLVIGVRGRRASSALRSIAKATGGRVFFSSLKRAVRRCRRLQCRGIVRAVIVRWHRRYLVRVRAYSSSGRYLGRRSGASRSSRGIPGAAYHAARQAMGVLRGGGGGGGGRARRRRAHARRRRRPRDDGGDIKIYTPNDGADTAKTPARQPTNPAPSQPPQRTAGAGDAKGDGDSKRDGNTKLPSWLGFETPKQKKPGAKLAGSARDGDKGDKGDKGDDGDDLFDEPDSEHGSHVSIKTLRTNRRQRHHTLISLAVGAGAMHRFQSLGVGAQSRGGDSNTAAELSLAASFYPLSLLTRSFMRDVGLGVGFTRAIGATLPLASGEAYSLKAMQFVVDLRWRWRSSPSPTAASVVALLGWGMRDALATPPDVLSIGYRFMRIGASGSLPIGTSMFGLVAGFELRPLLSVSSQATDVLGERLGGFGFAARAGFAGEHRSGFYYRVAFEAERYSSSFDGLDPAASTPRPGTADTTEPSSSSDTFLRFQALVGFAL